MSQTQVNLLKVFYQTFGAHFLFGGWLLRFFNSSALLKSVVHCYRLTQSIKHCFSLAIHIATERASHPAVC